MNFSYNGLSLGTKHSSTRQNNSATVTTVASVASVSNNVGLPVMSTHVVPSTVSNISTGTVASSFVTSVGTLVSTGVVYSVTNVVSPSTSLASAATSIVGNQGKYQTSVTFLADLTSKHVDVKINLIATTA